MLNLKSLISAVSFCAVPAVALADTCSTIPTCDDLGFIYTASECGALKKLKCPFDSKYFCSLGDTPTPTPTTCTDVLVDETIEKCTKKCATDATICIEKTYLPCKEAAKNLGLENMFIGPDDTINWNKYYIYLSGTHTINNLTASGSSNFYINDAKTDISPACEEGRLDILSLTSSSSFLFNVPTTIKNLNVSTDNVPAIEFGRNAKVYVHNADEHTKKLFLVFDGSDNEIVVKCKNSQKCNVDISVEGRINGFIGTEGTTSATCYGDSCWSGIECKGVPLTNSFLSNGQDDHCDIHTRYDYVHGTNGHNTCKYQKYEYTPSINDLGW